jgi:hypothetical protein
MTWLISFGPRCRCDLLAVFRFGDSSAKSNEMEPRSYEGSRSDFEWKTEALAA